MYLGTNYGHGAAAAIVSSSGELLYAVEEERLNGNKDSDSYPALAIQSAVSEFGDYSKHYEGWQVWKRLVNKGLKHTLKYGFAEPYYFKHRLYKECMRSVAFYSKSGSHCEVGHHLAHAYSLAPWGLVPNTLIFVSDALGERECISFYYWDGEIMHLVSKSLYPNSIGSLFHQLAYHVGFTGRQGPGKLMALSGYGEPVLADHISDLIRRDRMAISIPSFPIWKIRGSWDFFSKNILANRIYTEPNRDIKSRLITFNQAINMARGAKRDAYDIAASMQSVFTSITYDMIGEAVQHVEQKFGTVKAVGLTGGSALNCQATGMISRKLLTLGIKTIVPPWPDDSGTAIGAACKAYADQYGLDSIKKTEDPFLGPNINFKKHSLDEDGIRNAAHDISQGKIVALCSNKMEFGPRSLGARCILGAPTLAVRDSLNKLKKRPNFMPFAPIVFEDEFDRFFEGIGSKNMAWTVKAKPISIKEIPGAIHVTMEARVQVLPNNSELLLASIMREYLKLTGNSVLLLTSLNCKDEPISHDYYLARTTSVRLGCHAIATDERYSLL